MQKVFALAAVLFAFEDNLAVDEMVNNIEQDGTLRTGALWGGVRTRCYDLVTACCFLYWYGVVEVTILNHLEKL